MAESIIDKKNLWVLYLEGGQVSSIYGPFSMKDLDEGLKDMLVDNNYDETYDSLIGIEIDAKGRPHEFTITNVQVDEAMKVADEDLDTFEDPDFDSTSWDSEDDDDE